ncbi:hypothetical protein PGT21_015069 [Puccinia graminis f. sp. tritici]|uniref:Uncharacterized protein n=1 Tax=Puccinia graminis f. sp. tritici TaxID=56615 RepID=A0A5B0QT64_PUCGR|nr:hypothetical protein PGT21_015069 [Puccinia graminis f. sp. tritici]
MNIQNIANIISLGFIHMACASLRPSHIKCVHCEGLDVFPIDPLDDPTHGKCNYYDWESRKYCSEWREKEYYGCKRCQKDTVQNKSKTGDKCTHTNKQEFVWSPEPPKYGPAKAKFHQS